MVYDATEGLPDTLANAETVTAYIGFDPTASSLHVGSLLPMMALARLQRFGHAPIAIVGGGTGMIGDPSGKTQERQLLSLEQIEENVEGIRGAARAVSRFRAPPANPARIVNNADWLATIDLMEFLRDIGKHFTVNYMLAKDSVQAAARERGGHLVHRVQLPAAAGATTSSQLFDRYGCTLQMGGSDQWGNIIAGIDLIRKLRGEQGARPGHAAGDDGVGRQVRQDRSGRGLARSRSGRRRTGSISSGSTPTTGTRCRYLKFFTFLEQERIAALEAGTEAAPEKRVAQRDLAREVTSARARSWRGREGDSRIGTVV